MNKHCDRPQFSCLVRRFSDDHNDMDLEKICEIAGGRSGYNFSLTYMESTVIDVEVHYVS